MRLSHYFFATSKETPAEAELVSHQLMLKAGFIKSVASGLYSFLPMGYRVIDRITGIVKEEMDRIGGQQLLMPFVQPADLWIQSGRWEDYGPELLRFQDRKESSFVLSPTHEELITQLAGEVLNSYRKLPVFVYQIQIKFRDELRPRGGIIRAREFLMKDAYSFCQNDDQMRDIYDKMKDAYHRIFSRCGLNFKLVEAESGPIGGDISHEYIVTSSTGEDRVVECEECGYSSKLEKARSRLNEEENNEKMEKLTETSTPGAKSITEVSDLLNVSPTKLLKTIVYQTDKGFLGAVIRGDHQINEEKLKKVADVKELSLAHNNIIREKIGVEAGFVGPVGVDNWLLIADEAVMKGKNYVAGANKQDAHFVNVNPERDFSPNVVGDLRFVSSGDRCFFCGAPLKVTRGIEVGHLFQLGQRYSSLLGASFLDQEGEMHPLLMGCYGVGISRLPAAIIEQHNDRDGMIWPLEVAPFKIVVIPTNEKTFETSERIYFDLKDNITGDVLWDDRNVSAGVKFKDSDLIGIPLKIIVGNVFLKEGKIEIKKRKDGETVKVNSNQLLHKIREFIQHAG